MLNIFLFLFIYIFKYISDQRNSSGLTATELAEENGHDSLALLLKVENQFAPRPSGPSNFIPSSCDLDRPPTPTIK